MDTALESNAPLLGRLLWRCRRGMLENDLLITRFLEQHGPRLTPAQARALERWMDLSDNDLLELLLRRREPRVDEADVEMRALLELMRPRQEALTGSESK